MEEDNSASECAICLLPLLYPVKLPCSHEFCFLCIKGLRSLSAANDTRNCALCRTSFSFEQISQTLRGEKANSLTKCKWLYESKGNGFWQYDARTAIELEDAYTSKKDQISISIAGYTYIIDFVKMNQYRESHPTRTRKIRRQEESDDVDTTSSDNKIKVKGIAGLRVVTDEAATSALSESLSVITVSDHEDDEVILV